MGFCTLSGALRDAFDAFLDRPAISDGSRTLSYRQVRKRVDRLTDCYRGAGIGRGDRIVVAMANTPGFLIAAAAAWQCGAIHVAVDAESTPAELARIVGVTGARLVVHAAPADSPVPATESLPAGVPVVAIDGSGFAPPISLPAGDARRCTQDWRDAAVIFVSCGTTGTPKTTVGFDSNLAQRWKRLAGWLRCTPEDVHLVHLPLSHGFGLMMAVCGLLSGGRLVTMSRFSADGAVDLVDRERVTVFNGSPTHFKLLLDRMPRSGSEGRRLRLSVGTAATFPRALIERIWNELAVDFVYMYGSSEGIGVATADRDDIWLGSVGRPPAGSTRIVNPDRTDVAVGEVGEIAFSRRAYPVTYWTDGSDGQDPAEWFYSRDLGRLDSDGRLYVFGRLGHQIDRGGIKIDPVEVERALLNCPHVADAAVLGLPDPVLGETVCACVVPEEGATVTLPHLRGWLAHELATYKLPTGLRLLDRIPRTALGKTDLAALRTTCQGSLAR